MARKLEFVIEDRTIGLELEKVERSKLYGSSYIEAYDENGEKCELLSMMSDGKTLYGEGGSSIQTVTADLEVISKEDLTPVDLSGNPVERLESSFNAPVSGLAKASIDEYLSSTVKSVYAFADSADRAALTEFLKDGSIYKFDFSYRGGVVADICYLLLNNEGLPFMIVTNPADIGFVGFEDTSSLQEDEFSDEASVDELDFSMM